jgi:hypothetical protein
MAALRRLLILANFPSQTGLLAPASGPFFVRIGSCGRGDADGSEGLVGVQIPNAPDMLALQHREHSLQCVRCGFGQTASGGAN